MNATAATLAADRLTELVMAHVDAANRSEVQCPRERSFMTPCVARDGHTAVGGGVEAEEVCVGCGQDPVGLLAEFRDHHA